MRFAYGIAVVLLASCALYANQGDDQPPGDGGDATSTCARIQREWRELAASIDRQCTAPADCVPIGAVDTCNCTAHLAVNCSGDAVSRRGLAQVGVALDDREVAWRNLGCAAALDLGGTCDCAPSQATCRNNRCVNAPPPSCFGVDAGPLDAPSDGPL